ncbi:MAG TPA: fibronectin type III domain-containing protein, partial [Flavobacteriales bacterium]|nr:fibronectin type III domain-containing protein [Flavobacteriales bacterium]
MMSSFRLVRNVALIATLSLTISASGQRTCGSMGHLEQEMMADPQRAANLEAIENFTQNWIQQTNGSDRALVVIPVVFHVVYANATQNISDAKINAQIAQLNADYARLNSDASSTPSAFASLGANTEIQFCLAQRDPNGAATTGIIRKSTTTSSFTDTGDPVKFASSGGDNAWPAASYLNIWTCNLGGGLLGYAQFPGGSASTDGVVVLYSSVGSLTTPGTAVPYQYGRSATHEVGHWLNLRHIWGDANCGNDLVSDTPTQQTSNFGCPTYPHATCSNGSNGDMFMNYMDYTDDGCMNIFTTGQKSRMQALFATGGSRVSLASSLGCTPPSGGTCAVPTGLSSSGITSSGATVSWGAASGAVSYNLQYTPAGGTTTTVNTTSTSATLSGLSASTVYSYQVRTVCSASSSAYSTAASFTTSATGATCNTPTGLASSSVSTSGATISWSAVSGAVSYNLQYTPSGGATTTINTTATSYNLTGLASGTAHTVRVATVCGTSSSAYSSTISFTTASTGCSDTWESNNTSGTAKTISVNTDITALIGSNGDVDWYKFTNTSAASRMRINLTNLPADYDVKLYRGTNTLLATSQLGGTSSEQIINNTTTVTTYYIRVYGYNGAFSATQCYTLRANTSGTNFREGLFEDGQTIDAVEADGLMNVFPNPARDKVMIDYLSQGDGAIQ